MTKVFKHSILVALLCFCATAYAQEERPYLCEIGVQAGCGYYVGDAAPHIFMNPREAYGIQFRYKFTKRWALQVKMSGQRIVGHEYDNRGNKQESTWNNQIFSLDVVAEFNFFRFGAVSLSDRRIKPYTPYIFIGVGGSFYGMPGEGQTNIPFTPDWMKKLNELQHPTDGKKPRIGGMGAYIPLGIGFKWKFYKWAGLNIAWQHNIYIADDLESGPNLNDTHDLNGSNIMNCDVTGQLVVGFVFEFGQAPKPCRICNY